MHLILDCMIMVTFRRLPLQFCQLGPEMCLALQASPLGQMDGVWNVLMCS